VPGTGDGRHLEYRLADATANPYLVATGILAAIDDGLKRHLEPPPPATVDVGHLDDDEARAAGFDRLPGDPLTALAALDADTVLRAALGPVIADHYPRVKRLEAELASAAELDASDDGAAWHRWCWLETV
jgi:glutamine synthetase